MVVSRWLRATWHTRTSDRGVEGVGGRVDSDQSALHRGGDKQLGLICGLEASQAVPERSAGRPTAEPRQRRGGDVSCNGHFLARPRAARTVS